MSYDKLVSSLACLNTVRLISILIFIMILISMYVRFNTFEGMEFGFEGSVMGALTVIIFITSKTIRKLEK